MNAGTKNIVFDWNCTLLDDVAALFECVNIMFEKHNRPRVSFDEFQANYEVPFAKIYFNHGFTEEEVAQIVEQSKHIFHDHYEPYAYKANLRDGAAEVLSHASQAGIPMVILSNHIVEPIRTQLKRLSIEHHFHDVIAYPDRASQGTTHSKGEKLQRFMKERAGNPKQTIIVGDSIEEIQIAHQQGLISVAITGGCVSEKRLRAERPDHLIHSLHELKVIMQERGFA